MADDELAEQQIALVVAEEAGVLFEREAVRQPAT
jgi:hypothetical protein